MKSALPSHSELVDAIADATRATVVALFREHPDEHFYYVTLTIPAEVLWPAFSAWSWEALDAVVERDWSDDPSARTDLKWSYSDSPYYLYREASFDEVKRMFLALVKDARTLDQRARHAAADSRLAAIVAALKRVDGEGLFGAGPIRERIFINVEFAPPDYTNTQRAYLLNPPEAMKDWLREAAETE